MKCAKDDPMYYTEKIKKLIKEARENGLEVFTESNKLYFKANNCECWSVKLSKE